MALKCQHCQEEAYDDEEQVCKACGIVNDGIQFGSEHNPASTFKLYQNSCHRKKNRSNSLNYGTDILDSLCHEFSIATTIKMDAMTLLNFVYNAHTKAKKAFRSREDVGILAGCCLVNAQKKHNQFISFSDLCKKLNCSKKKAFKFTNLLKSYLAQDPTGIINYEDESNCLNDAEEEIIAENTTAKSDGCPDSLESSINVLLSKIPEDKKSELIKKTLSLTKLAYSCWLLTGRSREGVIIAAAYLCWKSMHATLKSVSLTRFCEDFSLNVYKARLRFPELKSMLLKLGQNIPSLTQNYVTEKNFIFHLNYILENSETLRNDFLTGEYTEDGMNLKEYNLYRAEYQKQKPHSSPVALYDSDMNASDVEISDTEISSYIRSDEQVKFIKKLKESKKPSKSDS